MISHNPENENHSLENESPIQSLIPSHYSSELPFVYEYVSCTVVINFKYETIVKNTHLMIVETIAEKSRMW